MRRTRARTALPYVGKWRRTGKFAGGPHIVARMRGAYARGITVAKEKAPECSRMVRTAGIEPARARPGSFKVLANLSNRSKINYLWRVTLAQTGPVVTLLARVVASSAVASLHRVPHLSALSEVAPKRERFFDLEDESASPIDPVASLPASGSRCRSRHTSLSPRNGAFAPFVRPTPQSDSWRHDRGRIAS